MKEPPIISKNLGNCHLQNSKHCCFNSVSVRKDAPIPVHQNSLFKTSFLRNRFQVCKFFYDIESTSKIEVWLNSDKYLRCFLLNIKLFTLDQKLNIIFCLVPQICLGWESFWQGAFASKFCRQRIMKLPEYPKTRKQSKRMYRSKYLIN